MSTAIHVITRALRLCGIVDANESIEANMAQDAREILNTQGQRWLASGLLAAWTDATGPQSALVTPVSADEALAYGLAIKLAPEYGVELSAATIEQAKGEIQSLWRDRLTATLDADTANALILRALRTLAGVGRLPDTVSFPAALNTLNAMLAEWGDAGFGFTAPTYSAPTSASALPSADHEAVAAQLALRLAPEYAVAITEPLAAQASSLLARLYSRYAAPGY